MKMKRFMMMMAASMAIVFSMSSCSSDDDDEPQAAVAAEVAGSYTGSETMTVMNEGSTSTVTYEITKATDTTIDMVIPEKEGTMGMPKLPVKNIVLTKGEKTVEGKLASYEGKVTTAAGDEKAYTVTDVKVLFSDKTLVVTFTLKYGRMPFAMITTFTGTKK